MRIFFLLFDWRILYWGIPIFLGGFFLYLVQTFISYSHYGRILFMVTCVSFLLFGVFGFAFHHNEWKNKITEVMKKKGKLTFKIDGLTPEEAKRVDDWATKYSRTFPIARMKILLGMHYPLAYQSRLNLDLIVFKNGEWESIFNSCFVKLSEEKEMTYWANHEICHAILSESGYSQNLTEHHILMEKVL